jgi:hypothetical protein
LTVYDAAATPVAHSFTPASRVAENTARWVDREHNAGVAIGFSTITMSVKEPADPSGVTRVKVTLSVPKVDFSVPTNPVLLGTGRVTTEYIFPGILNDQERKDLVELHSDLTKRNSVVKLGDNISVISLPY